MRTLGNAATADSKRALYIALVRSVLSYGSPLWSPYTKKEITSIESVQRLATRYITGYVDLPYKECLIVSNLLPLTYMRESADIVMFYNLIHGTLDVDLNRYFTINVCERRGIRHDRNMGINYIRYLYRTEQGRCFYTNRVLQLWSHLPLEVKTIPPPIRVGAKPRAFKVALFKFYWQKLREQFNVDNTCSWVTVCYCRNCRL
jgi:hypothetical protein